MDNSTARAPKLRATRPKSSVILSAVQGVRRPERSRRISNIMCLSNAGQKAPTYDNRSSCIPSRAGLAIAPLKTASAGSSSCMATACRRLRRSLLRNLPTGARSKSFSYPHRSWNSRLCFANDIFRSLPADTPAWKAELPSQVRYEAGASYRGRELPCSSLL